MTQSHPHQNPGQENPSPEAHAPEDKPDDYGREGTNKTFPEPKPDGAPSEELGNPAAPKHIENSPYTRG